MTFAVGEHARAAIAQPQACAPLTAGVAVKGNGDRLYKTTVTEDRDGKVGPDDVTTTTTTEPAFAPEAAQVPLHEAQGAKVSETGAGVLGTIGSLALGALKFVVPWFFPN